MKKYENLFITALIYLTVITAAQATGNDISYTPEQLTEQARIWLQQQIPGNSQAKFQTDITPLDPRIGSKNCSQPLSMALSQAITLRQNTIVLRCEDTPGWQLYVPVRIDEIVDAVVLRQNIATGSFITADTVENTTRERRFVRGNLVTDIQAVLGARTKRSLSLGQILTFQDLCLVCKGDVVTIAIQEKGLDVSATGVALTDGTLGDVVKIRNRQSQRELRAEVVGVNRVSVSF